MQSDRITLNYFWWKVAFNHFQPENGTFFAIIKLYFFNYNRCFIDLHLLYKLWTWKCFNISRNQNKNNFKFATLTNTCRSMKNHLSCILLAVKEKLRHNIWTKFGNSDHSVRCHLRFVSPICRHMNPSDEICIKPSKKRIPLFKQNTYPPLAFTMWLKSFWSSIWLFRYQVIVLQYILEAPGWYSVGVCKPDWKSHNLL